MAAGQGQTDPATAQRKLYFIMAKGNNSHKKETKKPKQVKPKLPVVRKEV